MNLSAAPIRALNDRALALLRGAGIAVAAGALLAILGPFGSYSNGGPTLLAAYWISATLLGLMLYGSAYKLVSRSVCPRSAKWWPALISATLVASVPEALGTRIMAFWLWPELTRVRLPLPLWFVQTATIGMISMAGVSFILRRATSTPEHDGTPLQPVEINRVPLGGDVLALQMEDHYVRVHRPRGSELVLMPLSRAIEQVGAEGLRTHRSWWVARDAVAAVEGNARSMRLHLSNGVLAPVARPAVAHLRAAGWIAAAEAANIGNMERRVRTSGPGVANEEPQLPQ
jgi:hypothetical protein